MYVQAKADFHKHVCSLAHPKATCICHSCKSVSTQGLERKTFFGMMLVQKQTPSSLVLWKLMGKRAEHTRGIAAIQERNDKGTKPDHRPKLLWELCG